MKKQFYFLVILKHSLQNYKKMDMSHQYYMAGDVISNMFRYTTI